VLIDFIGHEVNTSTWAKDYHRFLGGSPTNVAVNAARLGLKSVFSYMWSGRSGRLHCRKLNANAVVTSYLRKSDNEPSIIVSKSTSTPDFIAYREADCQIDQSQIPAARES
jgi:fructokinase